MITTNTVQVVAQASSVSLPVQIMNWSFAVVMVVVAVLLVTFMVGVIVSFVREEILNK